MNDFVSGNDRPISINHSRGNQVDRGLFITITGPVRVSLIFPILSIDQIHDTHNWWFGIEIRTYRDGRADRRAVISVVGCDRRAHERAALVQTARRSSGTLTHWNERVRVRGDVPMTVFLILDLLLRRKIFQIIFQVIRLKRFAKR